MSATAVNNSSFCLNPDNLSVLQWKDFLASIDRSKDHSWLAGLEKRKQEEATFHDQREDRRADGEVDLNKVGSNKKYYKYTQASRNYSEAWIKTNAPGKIFLDYACGEGNATIAAAKAGAKLAIGIDISAESVAHATNSAKKNGVEANTFFIQADCEDTRFFNESVDLVYCCGMLHHLNLSYAFPEMRRIMKPGAKAYAYEALNYNPIIKLYRMLTPHLRTNWEKHHILSLKDVEFAKRFFEVRNIKYWNISVIAAPHLPLLAPALYALDGLLTRIPGLQLLAWIFTFEMIKTEAN